MSRAAKAPRIMFLVSLTCAFLSVPVKSQFAEGTSVPEPTQLQAVASADDSILVRQEVLGEIETTDARASVSAIEIETPGGEKERGVKISLENSISTDRIYVTDNQVTNLREELKELDFASQFDGECQAKHRCIYGIARCRPSQTVSQAYCPSRYSTPKSEKGLILSTPRYSFLFPSVETGQLDTLLSEAAQVLD